MSDRDSPKDLALSFLGLLLFAGALAGVAYMLANVCFSLMEAADDLQRNYRSTRRGSSPGVLIVASGIGAALCAAGAVATIFLGARHYASALRKNRNTNDSHMPPDRPLRW